MKNLKLFALGLLSIFLLSSCNNDDDNSIPPIVGNQSITTIVSNNNNLTLFVDALKKANLTETFNQDGNYTVFAPTNHAFEDLLNTNNNWNSLEDIPVDVLTYILKYHVLDTELRSANLGDIYMPTLAEFKASGESNEFISLPILTSNGVSFDGETKPVTVDIEAKNGVVHVVDNVMLPNNIVDFAVDNPKFSLLVSALTDNRLSTDYIALLKSNGPFTVFAPTNSAFQNLLNSNANWNSISDIPVNILEAVLKYHVVPGANLQTIELSDDQEILTALGQKLEVDLTSSGTMLETTSGQDVNIIVTNIQGSNGVVHAVDQVLLPVL